MCSPLALLHALSIIGMVLTFIGAALYDGKLVTHFQRKHARVWAMLGRRRARFADGDDSPSVAMHWYLICGEHKKLQDVKLNAMVFTSRLLIAFFFCSAVALIFVQDRVSMDSYRACLGLL